MGDAPTTGERGGLGVAAEPAARRVDGGEVVADEAVRRRQRPGIGHDEPRPGAPQRPLAGRGAVLVRVAWVGADAPRQGSGHEPLEVACDRPEPPVSDGPVLKPPPEPDELPAP